MLIHVIIVFAFRLRSHLLWRLHLVLMMLPHSQMAPLGGRRRPVRLAVCVCCVLAGMLPSSLSLWHLLIVGAVVVVVAC